MMSVCANKCTYVYVCVCMCMSMCMYMYMSLLSLTLSLSLIIQFHTRRPQTDSSEHTHRHNRKMVKIMNVSDELLMCMRYYLFCFHVCTYVCMYACMFGRVCTYVCIHFDVTFATRAPGDNNKDLYGISLVYNSHKHIPKLYTSAFSS